MKYATYRIQTDDFASVLWRFANGARGLMDYPPGHVEGFPDTLKMNFRAIYSAITGFS